MISDMDLSLSMDEDILEDVRKDRAMRSGSGSTKIVSQTPVSSAKRTFVCFLLKLTYSYFLIQFVIKLNISFEDTPSRIAQQTKWRPGSDVYPISICSLIIEMCR